MTLAISTSKLAGIPGGSGWAQVHEFKPEDPEKLKLRGHLIAAVAVQKEEEPNAVSVGREFITRLQEEYFGKEEGSAFNALKAAVEKVVSEFGAAGGEVEMAAAAVVEDVVYAAVGGEGKVAIFRDGILANILEGKKGNVTCASGYPKDGDMLLLGTASFFRNFSNEVISAGLKTGDCEAAVESFAPTLHSQGNASDIGVAVIGFTKGEEGLAVPAGENLSAQKRKISLNLSGITSFFGKLARSLPERKIYVRLPEGGDEEGRGGRRTTLTIGIILLILLFVSIGFGIKAKRDKENKATYAATLSEASHELSEAEALYTLNPPRARELLADSRDKISELLARKISDPELTALKAKIDEDVGTILGEYKVEPEEFINLSLLSSGFNGDALFASGDKAYVLDKAGKKIISITFATKRSEVVAGPGETGTAVSATAYEDRVFVEDDTGVYEVTGGRKKVITKDWTGEAWIYAYTGNMYILDKGGGMIWRYQGVGDSFGTKQKWFGPGVSPDFSRAVSWTIDGSIWVINGNGQILKFTQGAQDAFSATGIAPSLDSAVTIYTNENLKYVYILEAKKDRIVILSKDGKFAAQYLSDKIGQAKGLVVSEADKKMILLLGNKLYSIELKHL